MTGARVRGSARSSLVLGSPREIGTVALVAGMCGFYASALLIGSDLLAVDAEHAGGSSAVGVILGAVASVFIAVAAYVTAVVIANGVDTVMAGRLRQIAVLRLLGADAASLRMSVVRGATAVATVGAVVGLAVGVLVGDLTRWVLVSGGSLPEGDYTWLPLLSVPAGIAIVLAAGAAAWVGSRVVLRVTPAQALLGASLPPDTGGVGRPRRLASYGLIGAGAVLLAGAAALGEAGTAVGLLVAALGAMLSGTGILIGARVVVPGLVSLTSRLLGSGPSSVIASRNALRQPARTTRSTMGLVIGVTLVTTFAAGFAALRTSAHNWDQTAVQAAQTDEILRTVSVLMICVVAASSAIAAVGFVSTMSLSVVQRTREIGLLRALGFTARQVRSMITKESIALLGTATVFGVTLGLLYGAVGAQSLIGFRNDGLAWGVPGVLLAGVVGAGVVLVLAASWVPASRAVAIPPVEALQTSGQPSPPHPMPTQSGRTDIRSRR